MCAYAAVAVQAGFPEHAIGRASVKRAMRPELIIEPQVTGHALLSIVNGLVDVERDLFIFKAPPQPFDEHIIPPAPGPIHTDLNPVVFQAAGKFLARELGGFNRSTQPR